MATKYDTDNLNTAGNPEAKIVVICDAPSQVVFNQSQVMSNKVLDVFGGTAREHGFKGSDFFFITASPPIPEIEQASEGRTSKYVGQFREELVGILKQLQNVRTILPLGKIAARQVYDKSVKITQIRGKFASLTGEMPESLSDVDVFPMLSPANVLSRPEVQDTFDSDFALLRQYVDVDYKTSDMVRADDVGNFEWCLDLSHVLANPPKALSLDIESDGLRWMEDSKILVVSMAWSAEKAIVIPLDVDYWNRHRTPDQPVLTQAIVDKLVSQLIELLGNPAVAVTGQNLKFDLKFLKRRGIIVANWMYDTLQLAFAADENMISKGLDECVKRWLPEMAGYSDTFQEEQDYSKMREVPLPKMLTYSGGDALATFLLTRVLVKLVKQDRRNWMCFEKVQMPALRTFAKMEEWGIKVDKSQLTVLQRTLGVMERDLYDRLIRQVHGDIKRKHFEEKGQEGLSFGRAEFVQDILFNHPKGFCFKPIVFTDTTKKLPPDQRIPSVSTKQHLPYFADNTFVAELIQYQKLQKMRSTYVGAAARVDRNEVPVLKNGNLPKRVTNAIEKSGYTWTKQGQILNSDMDFVRPRPRVVKVHGVEQTYGYRIKAGESLYLINGSPEKKNCRVFEEITTEPTGFWKHLRQGDRIYPSFFLHNTVTGRSSSKDPTFQNVPKRGAVAKEFRKVFIPEPGFVLGEADLSQAEIRVAASMAKEQVMLRIYREGGDIHSMTAAAIVGVSYKEFASWEESKTPLPDKIRKSLPNDVAKDCDTYGKYYEYRRFQAKAVNFGFLYGMGWRKFQTYAKTDYSIDLTEEEAQHFRNTFFRLYPGLERWHRSMRNFVGEHGYVRALHGALRRLPNIESEDDIIKGESERQAINSPVQRFASDLGLMAMSAFGATCPWELARPIAFIHDAVVIEVREDLAVPAMAGMKWYMENTPLDEFDNLKLPCPIIGDCGIGQTLSGIKKVKVEPREPDWAKILGEAA